MGLTILTQDLSQRLAVRVSRVCTISHKPSEIIFCLMDKKGRRLLDKHKKILLAHE
jgi:hypothetical protein